MRNFFWLVLGAVIAALVITRGRALMHKVTPAGIAEQVERKGQDTAAGLGELYATFRTSMAAREAELREELGMPDNA